MVGFVGCWGDVGMHLSAITQKGGTRGRGSGWLCGGVGDIIRRVASREA